MSSEKLLLLAVVYYAGIAVGWWARGKLRG